MAILKMLLFVVTVVGTVLAYIPMWLVRTAPYCPIPRSGLRALAVLSWLCGGAIVAWVIRTFLTEGGGTPAPNAPTQTLVVEGLYRYLRHPMYVGALLILLGHALWFQMRRLFVYLGIIFGFFHAVVVLYEEPQLIQQFGEVYQDYCQKVPRWLPRRPTSA